MSDGTYQILIEVNDNTKRAASKDFAGAGASGGGSGPGGTAADSGDSGAQALAMFAVQKIASPVLSAAVNYYKSHVSMYTGSRDLQDKVDFGFQIAGTLSSIAGATVAGGLALGPLGAAIGFIGGVVATGISLEQKRMEYNYSRSWDNVSAGEQRGRAGPSFNRSRTGS